MCFGYQSAGGDCLLDRTAYSQRVSADCGQSYSALSAHISDRDNSVRSATLNALVGVYAQLEEATFWKYLGSVRVRSCLCLLCLVPTKLREFLVACEIVSGGSRVGVWGSGAPAEPPKIVRNNA